MQQQLTSTKNASRFVTLLLFFFAISCSSSDDPAPIDCSSLSIAVTPASIAQPTGCSTTDGSFSVTASGGEEPYQYSIDGSTFQSTAIFSNLGSGTYTVTVKDANDCTKESANIQLTSAASTLQIVETIADESGCKTSTGQIAVSATGGQAPYQYSINGTTFVTASTFQTVTAGIYTVTVKDALGCIVTKSNVKVLSGVSYQTEIKPILQVNCVKSGCHDGGNSLPNLSNLSTVQSRSATIKSMVQSGAMPKDGTLTQQQKDLIACWVDDGALDN